MVLSMWAPDSSGAPRLRSGSVPYARRLRTDTGVFGKMSLSMVGVGYFPECRLMQYRKGGFFATGEWLLDAREHSYPKFVEFEGAFSTWLAMASRLEIVGSLLEEYGELYPDDEVLALDENELADLAVPEPLGIDEIVRIETPKQKGRLVSRRAQFDAVVGNSIRVRGCRLAGSPGRATLVLPTSEGLALRPIQLETSIEMEIIQRAEAAGVPPIPFAV